MQLPKSGHPYIEAILTYYRGCNNQDFDLMMFTFLRISFTTLSITARSLALKLWQITGVKWRLKLRQIGRWTICLFKTTKRLLNGA
jgi:hypothetical protein